MSYDMVWSDNYDLKPCPFCGADEDFRMWENPHETSEGVVLCVYHRVICGYCRAMGAWGLTEKVAVECWNRRVKE